MPRKILSKDQFNRDKSLGKLDAWLSEAISIAKVTIRSNTDNKSCQKISPLQYDILVDESAEDGLIKADLIYNTQVFSSDVSFTNWFYTIIKNETINHLEKLFAKHNDNTRDFVHAPVINGDINTDEFLDRKMRDEDFSPLDEIIIEENTRKAYYLSQDIKQMILKDDDYLVRTVLEIWMQYKSTGEEGYIQECISILSNMGTPKGEDYVKKKVKKFVNAVRGSSHFSKQWDDSQSMGMLIQGKQTLGSSILQREITVYDQLPKKAQELMVFEFEEFAEFIIDWITNRSNEQ